MALFAYHLLIINAGQSALAKVIDMVTFIL